MPHPAIRTLTVALVLLASACAVGLDDEAGDLAAHRAAITASGGDGMLALLNDQGSTTLERLDVGCAIRSDSAAQLIKHRDGHDRLPYTADDDLFDDVAEVDAVSMVGAWTLDRLAMCAWLFGYMQGVGPTLGGQGQAAIDGAMAPGEWAGAAAYPFAASLPDGGTTPATLYVMNDAQHVYFAVALEGMLLDRMVRFLVQLDNDDDGFVEAGDDYFGTVFSPYSSVSFSDAHIFEVSEVAGDTIAAGYMDTYFNGNASPDDDGTIDGQGAVGAAGGLTVIEMAHPLDSADDLYDVSLAPGSSLGISFSVAVLGDVWIETRGWGALVIPLP